MFLGKKSTILIIDSDKSVLNTFRRLLEKKGYQVITAETGKEAVKKLSSNKYDGAMVDSELSDIVCLDLLFQIQENSPRITKIIFNSLPKLQKSIEDNNSNRNVFLEKPVQPAKLLDILDKALQENQ
jgi:DNA-binding NtrC family response regulator